MNMNQKKPPTFHLAAFATLLIALIAAPVMSHCQEPTPARVPPYQRDNTQSVVKHLQDTSVTVRVDTPFGSSSGSGTIVVRNFNGTNVAFVWTAHHVVEHLRQIRTVSGSHGDRKVVSYGDPTIVKQLLQDGNTTGDTRLFCKVLTCSPKNDIAILQVRQYNSYGTGVEFDLSEEVTPVATELFHCGSPAGQALGHNSLTSGIIAANGRMFDGLSYDQTTVNALPGSSGGIVARRGDGKCVGLLTLGIRNADSFNYIVPSRRIVEWCKENDLLWAVDPQAKLPALKDLNNIPIEDTLVQKGVNGVSADQKSEEESSDSNLLWKKMLFKSKLPQDKNSRASGN